MVRHDDRGAVVTCRELVADEREVEPVLSSSMPGHEAAVVAALLTVSNEAVILEQYLDARKRSATGPELLDTMPFYAAWRTCEVIGAVALHGRDARLRELSDDDWREAGASGFVVASGGPQKIREFLQGLWLADSQRSRSAGPWTRFGQFFRWLRTTKDDPNFDLVRDVVLDFVADTAPVGPEDELFGRQIVQERRLHSVFTAHRASGLHYKRLRRVLRSAGVLPPDSDHLNDSLVVFPASKAEPIIDLLQHAITLKQAESYLNAGRVHTRLLEKHGFIQSIKGSAELELGDAAYDCRYLDAFMEQLSAKAITIAELGRSQLSIAAAAKRACCSSMEIVRLILDHRLGWLGQLSDETGFKSLVVNFEEVRTLTRGERTDDLNVAQAADALGSTYRVISTLTKNKLLASKRAINPMNRCPYVAVSRAVLDEFKVRYVSLHELARSRRAGLLNLRRQLSEIGILPAFDPSQSAATFYLRSEIPIAF